MFFFLLSISIEPVIATFACDSDSICARLRSVATKGTGKGAGRAVRMGTKPVSLKELAERLGLSPATVSLVINRSPVADSIPQDTKDRILAAARKFKYRPNFFARSLRTQRSFTIGVIVPEVSDGYSATVMSGVEDYLLQEGYFYFVASHRHRADLIDEYPRMFLERSVDGLIAVDTPWRLNLSVPVVTVSGHNDVKGVRSEEHTSELQSRVDLVCRILLEKKKKLVRTFTSLLHILRTPSNTPRSAQI